MCPRLDSNQRPRPSEGRALPLRHEGGARHAAAQRGGERLDGVQMFRLQAAPQAGAINRAATVRGQLVA
jgi:hypothetical protein